MSGFVLHFREVLMNLTVYVILHTFIDCYLLIMFRVAMLCKICIAGVNKGCLIRIW